MTWKDILKGEDDWRKKLKFGGKGKPKWGDIVIEHLKINPKRTLKQIQLNLENTHPRGKSIKVLRKFLEEHKDVQVLGKYPTKYSYRGE